MRARDHVCMPGYPDTKPRRLTGRPVEYPVGRLIDARAECSVCIYARVKDKTFPADGKRTRSAVIRQALAQKIVDYLKGAAIEYRVRAAG